MTEATKEERIIRAQDTIKKKEKEKERQRKMLAEQLFKSLGGT